MGNFFYNLGKAVGQSQRKANWVLQSLTGTEAEQVEAEHAVGRDLARSYLAEVKADPEPDVQRYLDEVGARLAPCVADRRRTFTFRSVLQPELNAFALPGGFVFVTRALLERCEWNADEVAFVLGHEMGHIVAKHAINRMMASSLIRGGLARVPIGGIIGMGVLQAVTALLNQGYSQDQELEADHLGMKLIHYAGFDLAAARRVLLRLGAIPAEGWLGSSYLSSHPPLPVRIERVERYVREEGGSREK